MMGPRSSSPANIDGSVSVSLSWSDLFLYFPTYISVIYVLALKQTQAVDPQIKAEAQAEASTESPEPVSIEADQPRCEGVCQHPLFPKAASGKGFEVFWGVFASLGKT